MVSAPFIRHRNKLIILQYKWKPTNKWMAQEALELYSYMTKIIFIVVQNNKASLKCSKDKADIIEDVYSCIRANAHQLTQFPELVPQLCLNEPDKSYCDTLAQVSQLEKHGCKRIKKILRIHAVREVRTAEAHCCRNWKPIVARKFGYDISVRSPARPYRHWR